MLALLPAYAAGFGVARLLDTAVPQPAGLLLALLAGSLAYVSGVLLVGGILPRDRELGESVARRIWPGFAAKHFSPARRGRLRGVG